MSSQPDRNRTRPWLRRDGLRELLFRVGVWMKGIDGILELAGGIALLTVSPAFILRTVRFLTQDEIAEDPHDLLVVIALIWLEYRALRRRG